MRNGWTLTEMIVTLGVTSVLLALAFEMALLVMHSSQELQESKEKADQAMMVMEQVISDLIRAERVTVTDEGLTVKTKAGVRRWRRTLSVAKMSGEWDFAWEKDNLISVTLKWKEKGKERSVSMKVFVPLWKRRGEME
jgi:prepilin-type N-terminal cleavage/methylation domain-containing protein